MPRPKQCRRVCLSPDCTYFKPAGVPTSSLEEIVLAMDELEALRLVDLQAMYQEQAAERMGVSRRTFGRIIDSARAKVAEALIRGMALRIQGGVIEMVEQRTFQCADCGHQWQLPFGTGRPSQCPQCGGANFRRAEEERGHGRRRRTRGGGKRRPEPADGEGAARDAANEQAGVASTSQRARRRRRRQGRAST